MWESYFGKAFKHLLNYSAHPDFYLGIYSCLLVQLQLPVNLWVWRVGSAGSRAAAAHECHDLTPLLLTILYSSCSQSNNPRKVAATLYSGVSQWSHDPTSPSPRSVVVPKPNALCLSRIFSPSLTTTSSFPPGGMNFQLSSLFGLAWLLLGWYDFKYGMMFWLARLGRFLTPPCPAVSLVMSQRAISTPDPDFSPH